jgi:hypothetical protein
LFLQSCLLERDRAKRVGFAYDNEDYDTAVVNCLKLLLEAYPSAAAQVNGDGRLPLHLAIENVSHISFDSVLKPLLHQAPRALTVRDMKTRLYPFAASAVGRSANLDLVYNLLKLDPGCLQKQVVLDNVTGRKRKLPVT